MINCRIFTHKIAIGRLTTQPIHVTVSVLLTQFATANLGRCTGSTVPLLFERTIAANNSKTHFARPSPQHSWIGDMRPINDFT
jgi:hypothetical protein